MTGTSTGVAPSPALEREEGHPAENAREAARTAGLWYVTDTSPGIRRKRQGKHFRYLAPDGQSLRDSAELERITALRIPPAWNDVWICPQSQGHLQATGRDAKGRKQYRYHDRWREVRDETKYDQLIPFGENLPGLRQQVSVDMEIPGLSHAKFEYVSQGGILI